MSSNSTEKAVMEASPVSTSSDSSPQEEKCILTPLSLEFDPLNWQLDSNQCNTTNDSNSNSNDSVDECSAAIVDNSLQTNDLMTDSVQSFDLLTMDDNFNANTNHMNGDKCQSNLELIQELEPTLNCEMKSVSNSAIEHNSNAVNDIDIESDLLVDNSSVSKDAVNVCQMIASLSESESNPLNDCSTNQSISLMSEPIEQTDLSHDSGDTDLFDVNDKPLIDTNVSDVSGVDLIATKLANECVSDALHENSVHLTTDQMLNSSSSLSASSQASSLSDHISSDSDESIQSVSSSGSARRKKKNTRKKASKAQVVSSPAKAQPSAPHELPQQLHNTTGDAKNNSIEANKKSVDNHIIDAKPELNGQTVNGDEMNDMNVDMSYLPEINGFAKHVNNELLLEPSLNGHKRHYDFDNDSLNESPFATEPDYCVNVAKLKNQYVSHIENETQLLKPFPKAEIANTGIDFKSLKNSYVSTAEQNVVHKNALNRELLPIGVNINSIKSTFNSDQEMIEAEKEDKTRGPKKFAQINKDLESICKVCAKHVYQMEKIKAEKSVFHKQCFRCKECNKQLNVDNYSSHEGQLYCMPHFKQLFQPKAKFDTEDQTKTNSRVEEQFDNLSLDLANIRNRFETRPEDNHNNHSNNIDKTTLQRSESLHSRMQKYQSAVSGEKDTTDSDEGQPIEPNGDQPDGEKVVFSGLSSLKSQWETGSIAGGKDEAEATRDELEDLRKKLSLGRSESMRQTYERAVKESHNETAANRSDAYVIDSSVKTTSIKEKFEKGFPENETEEQKIERLKSEREEEIQAIAESESAAKEARNKFKQIDASATRAPTTQLNGHSNHINGSSNKLTNGDVVKSGEPNGEDVSIDSAQLQERFSYFENLPKEAPKEPKRHQITPPRDVTHVYENSVADSHNSNIIRSSDAIEDIPKVDTTKKMLDKFKALESQTDNQSNAPKPLKRITPPRDTTADSEHKRESSPERDPNIIKSSLKSEESIEVEPEKARNLKAKFENWSAEIDRENKKNNGYDDEEEFIPHIDTTKNLRAKFEAIKDESKPIDKPKIRVNRFVCETSDNASDACYVCRTKLYPMEKLEFSGIRLHKNCFRCIKCKCNLRLDNFTITADKLYCIPHFKQLFMEKGNYDEGFGLEQHKDKWMNKCINNNDLIINNNNNNQLICDVNANDALIDYANQSVSDASDNEY